MREAGELKPLKLAPMKHSTSCCPMFECPEPMDTSLPGRLLPVGDPAGLGCPRLFAAVEYGKGGKVRAGELDAEKLRERRREAAHIDGAEVIALANVGRDEEETRL